MISVECSAKKYRSKKLNVGYKEAAHKRRHTKYSSMSKTILALKDYKKGLSYITTSTCAFLFRLFYGQVTIPEPHVCFKDILFILDFFSPYLPALPQWVRMINDTQMDSGEKLQWECKAMGRPRPTYHWLLNGLPLTSQVPPITHGALSFCWLYHKISELFLWNYTSTIYSLWCTVYLHLDMSVDTFFSLQGRVEIVNGELTIHRVQQADSGMYQCVARNKYGAIYSNAELNILGNYTFWFLLDKTWHQVKGLFNCHEAAIPVGRAYSWILCKG